MEMTSETTQMMPGAATATRHCPLGIGAQCPILNGSSAATDIYCPECGFLVGSEPEEGFAHTSNALSETRPYLEDQTGRAHHLRVGANSVGREGTEVLLPDKTVSRNHAQIVLTEEGLMTVEDTGSTNGTQVNGERLLLGTQHAVNIGDTVRFGSVRLLARMPGAESNTAPAAQIERTTELPKSQAVHVARLISETAAIGEIGLSAGTTTFGRSPANTVVLNQDPYISGRHAQIMIDGQSAQVIDVGSTNGTTLNGTRLTPQETLPLVTGDEIAFGGTKFRFQWQQEALESETEMLDADPPASEQAEDRAEE